MTGVTLTIDQYYCSNYNKLLQYCNKYHIEEDEINNTYLKLKRVVSKTGMTESDYFKYIRKAFWNQIRDDHKARKRKGYTVPIEDNINLAEEVLHEVLEWETEEQQYREELQYFSKMLFKYIDTRGIFTDIDVFILKSYVFCDITYRELEQKIGISEDVCKKTMRKFRADIRLNFIKWLNDRRGN